MAANGGYASPGAGSRADVAPVDVSAAVSQPSPTPPLPPSPSASNVVLGERRSAIPVSDAFTAPFTPPPLRSTPPHRELTPTPSLPPSTSQPPSLLLSQSLPPPPPQSSSSSSCLESCPKDSIIAQILGGGDGEFGDGGLCPPGVFFDDAGYPPPAPTTAPTCSFGQHDVWTTSDQYRTSLHAPRPSVTVLTPATRVSRSLLVGMDSRGCGLQRAIEQVVTEHEVLTCSPVEAVSLCNEQNFALIWLQLPCPPTEDILGVITGIRYSSTYNKKTVQLGVSMTQPEIDLNLHGIDEIILEPVSRSTIRQKYFDWTSVKLTPDYELSMRDHPMSPTTPDSSVSTESNIELSLSSLASDTTNDSGIQAELDVVDLKPPSAPFLCRPQHPPSAKAVKVRMLTGSPTTPPSWCRAEHATKEKHRRERIKDSCDQLRVLLPYVRGRKTDMASILEMTVDYLKIVNSKLPHEFHAHVLDIMTNNGNSPPPSRPARAQQSGGRGSRGGRGRASRRTPASPARAQGVQDNGGPEPVLTRSSRSAQSAASSRGGPRASKAAKRGSQVGVALSPASHGVSGLYLADGKDRGISKEEGLMSMSLPTYIQSAHHPAPHALGDTSSAMPLAPSSCLPTSSLSYPLPPGQCAPPPSSAADCGLPLPRLYASAHLPMEPGFLPHGGPAPPPLAPPPLAPPPLSSRYSLGGERESGGLPPSFGDGPALSYYHFFSNTPDVSPAYSVAGGGGGAGGGATGCGSAVPMCGDFMSPGAGSLLPLSVGSTFPGSARLQGAASRGKAEPQAVGVAGEALYTMMDTSVVKATKG